MYVIIKPVYRTNTEGFVELHERNCEEVQVQKVLKLVVENQGQEGQYVITRVVDLVGHVVLREDNSVGFNGSRLCLDSLKQPVLKILPEGRISILLKQLLSE